MSLREYASAGEARVARRLVREGLARGFAISVRQLIDSDSEWVVSRSKNLREICDALAAADVDVLYFQRQRESLWFALIWGNDADGSELIADHENSAEADQIYTAVCD